MYFLLKDKIPHQVDFKEWLEKSRFTQIAKTSVNDACISTVFIEVSLDINPRLFETMIFYDKEAVVYARYFTWEEAEAGHNEAVAIVKGKAQELQ